jgi:hypothetical protein
MGDSRGAGWVPHEWEDDVDMYGCEEQPDSDVPQGWKTIEMHIDRIDGYVRIIVTEEQTGRTVFASRYSNEVAMTMAQMLTLNAIKNQDDENA